MIAPLEGCRMPKNSRFSESAEKVDFPLAWWIFWTLRSMESQVTGGHWRSKRTPQKTEPNPSFLESPMGLREYKFLWNLDWCSWARAQVDRSIAPFPERTEQMKQDPWNILKARKMCKSILYPPVCDVCEELYHTQNLAKSLWRKWDGVYL